MSRLPLVAFLTVAAGCSDPQFSEPAPDSGLREAPEGRMADAGVARDADAAPQAPQDATTQPTEPDAAVVKPAEGPWHQALAKRYAVSTRFFGKDRGLADQALYSHEILQLAQITITDGKVTMETVRCRDHGNVIALGIVGEFEWAYPAKLAPQQFELVMRPDGIRSEAPPRAIGFTTQPSECVNGQAQVAVTGRKWLANGRCDCRTEPAPVVARDCRVIDEDGDGNQAITLYRSGAINDPEYTRFVDSTQIVQGQLGEGGRIEARFIENYDTQILMCGDSVCGQHTIGSCPLPLSQVLFEPLADRPWTCDQVLDEVNAGRLFPLPMLNFVNGC